MWRRKVKSVEEELGWKPSDLLVFIKCINYFLEGQISAWAFSDLYGEMYRRLAQGRPEEVELALVELYCFCEDWDYDETDREKFRVIAGRTRYELEVLRNKYWNV